MVENREGAQVYVFAKGTLGSGLLKGQHMKASPGPHTSAAATREVLQDQAPWCSAPVLLLGWKSWRQQRLCR